MSERETDNPTELTRLVADIRQAGLARWPQLRVGDALLRDVAAEALAHGSRPTFLADLYLAAACLEYQGEALLELDKLMSQIGFGPKESKQDEVSAEVLRQLLFHESTQVRQRSWPGYQTPTEQWRWRPERGREPLAPAYRPALLRYYGQNPLVTWLRSFAINVLMSLAAVAPQPRWPSGRRPFRRSATREEVEWALENALEELSEDHLELLRLKILGGLSSEELAVRSALTPRVALTHLSFIEHVVRSRLRSVLGPDLDPGWSLDRPRPEIPLRDVLNRVDTPDPPLLNPEDNSERATLDPVHLAVSSPRAAMPGDSFSVRFAAYPLSEEALVRQQLGDLGGGRTREQMGVARCQWARQTRVTVKVSGKHLKVEPDEQTFEWRGRSEILGFSVEVQATSAATTALRFEVFIQGVRVAFIPVDLALGGSPVRAEVTTRASARTAFASYATADRSLILQKLASIRDLAGIDVFLDCLSLRPSEQWKRRIEEEIASRDLFLLFWCRHASASEWVDWEWRRALQSKGDAAFQLQPLEPPAEAPPPAELSHLHFNDPLILLAGPHPE